MVEVTHTPVRVGQVTNTDGPYVVVVGGAPKTPIWSAGYTARNGDYVTVAEFGDTAFVLGLAATSPLPLTGLVSGAPDKGRVPVEADGIEFQCRYFTSPAPEVDQRVCVYWSGSDPVVFPGVLATVPEDPIAPTPPAAGGAGPTSGQDIFLATAAGTQRPSGWEWGSVKQGSFGSQPSNRGAWFYGTQVTRLAGRTVDRIRIVLGPRDGSVGNYNDELTGHFYAATGSVPNAWAALTGGHDATVHAVGSPSQEIDLPPAWAVHLLAGNGIGIAGNPYLGIKSGGTSGALIIDWSS